MKGDRTESELADQIRDASQNYYGTAIEAFLRELVQLNSDSIRRLVAEKKNEFLNFVRIPSDAHGQVRRVAHHFALVAAGGELAIQFGVVPWKEGEPTRAAMKCFNAWLDTQEGGAGDQDAERAMEQLKAHLHRNEENFPIIARDASLGGEFIDTGRGSGRRNVEGYRRMDNGKVTEWLIYPDVFKELFQRRGHNARDVSQALLKQGYLAPDGNGKATAKNVRIRGGNPRMYVIRGAFTEGEAEKETI